MSISVRFGSSHDVVKALIAVRKTWDLSSYMLVSRTRAMHKLQFGKCDF